MSITAETAKEHANDPAVLCCRAEEGITIQASNLEDPAIFEADLDFHELDSWSSLTSLGVVAMVYQEYGVELDTQDVRNADTIEDLFNIVKERKA